MKIQYMSDLHLEFGPFTVDHLGDVLVLAGDIVSGSSRSRDRFEEMLSKCADFEAILMVIGNHEGYYTSYPEAREYLRGIEEKVDNFHLLDCDSITVGDVTFHGCTLWSDPESEHTRRTAACMINDYRLIDGWSFEQHCENHQIEMGWLEAVVKPGDVIITHFCPHPMAINHERYGGDVINSWYASDLTDFIEQLQASAWISGHTHNVWAGKIGNTAVLGNCRGYYRYGGNEVGDFDPHVIFEV